MIWWVRAYDSQHSPLGRLLMCRDQHGNVAASATYAPTEAAVHARLEELAARVPGRISVERCAAAPITHWDGVASASGDLAAARFERDLDRAWRRTSYSGITAGDRAKSWAASRRHRGSVTNPMTPPPLRARRPESARPRPSPSRE